MDFGIIQKLAKCIIRPPRSTYHLSQMGFYQFLHRNRTYQRQDFIVINNRGLELQCSFIKDKFSPIARQTIIFLHANSSNRLVVKNYMEIFLPYYDLVSFDFAGCGLSEGQFITLGYNEREDVYSVIRNIRQRYGVKEVILWGRSMGAATAILYSSKYRGIKAIICDNSFSDLSELVNELSDQYIPILPSFLVDTVINSIQDYIQQNIWKKQITDFHIKKLKPLSAIQKIKCPIFFIGSQDDTFVNVRHTKLLYQKTKTYKHLQLVKGDHNDNRKDAVKQKVLHFLVNLNQNIALHSTTNSRPPSRTRISIFKSIQKSKTVPPSLKSSPSQTKTQSKLPPSKQQQTQSQYKKLHHKLSLKDHTMNTSHNEDIRSNILDQYFNKRQKKIQTNNTCLRRKRIFDNSNNFYKQ